MPKTGGRTALMPLRTFVILTVALLPGFATGVLAFAAFPPGSVFAPPVLIEYAFGGWVATASGLDHMVE